MKALVIMPFLLMLGYCAWYLVLFLIDIGGRRQWNQMVAHADIDRGLCSSYNADVVYMITTRNKAEYDSENHPDEPKWSKL